MENSINLLFNISPISYNETHIVFNNTLRSSTKRKNFGVEVQKLLTLQHKELSKIKNQNVDRLEVRYCFFVPELRTKTGTVAKRSLDIDNCIKALQDEIFKRLNKINSNIDDGMILKITAEKLQSPGQQHITTATIYWQ